MSTCLLILPNQMFHDTIRTFNEKMYTIDTIIIIEEPLIFSHGDIKPNKIKVAYLRACMKFLEYSLRKEKKHVTYISYGETLPTYQRIKKVYMFDPVDHTIKDKYTNIYGTKLHILETPMFIAHHTWLDEFHATSIDKKTSHAKFFSWMKGKLGILDGVPNMDTQNRQRPPKQGEYKNIEIRARNIHKDIYNEARAYTLRLFPHHVGDAEHVDMYPIDPQDAKRMFDVFLSTRLKDFGPYQDIIIRDCVFLYHSAMSAALNAGVIDVRWILKRTLEYHKRNSSIPMQSVEGFLRQVIGWREYMRYLYMYRYNDMVTSNIPKNNVRTIHRSWYNATTGDVVLDTEISKAVKYGYAHHIVRLMVFLNQLIQRNIHPHLIYTWFMNVVSIDAYDWVMIPNIYAMGYFWDGGMRKPYLCSSNYILNMSDYKKDGHWDEAWKKRYHTFMSVKPKAYVQRKYL